MGVYLRLLWESVEFNHSYPSLHRFHVCLVQSSVGFTTRGIYSGGRCHPAYLFDSLVAGKITVFSVNLERVKEKKKNKRKKKNFLILLSDSWDSGQPTRLPLCLSPSAELHESLSAFSMSSCVAPFCILTVVWLLNMRAIAREGIVIGDD